MGPGHVGSFTLSVSRATQRVESLTIGNGSGNRFGEWSTGTGFELSGKYCFRYPFEVFDFSYSSLAHRSHSRPGGRSSSRWQRAAIVEFIDVYEVYRA